MLTSSAVPAAPPCRACRKKPAHPLYEGRCEDCWAEGIETLHSKLHKRSNKPESPRGRGLFDAINER